MKKEEKICNALEGRDIDNYIDEYYHAEGKILKELTTLPKHGGICDCGEVIGMKEGIKLIHNGLHFDEIVNYCINCGGMIEE